MKRAYWDHGICGPEGEDANWELCGTRAKNCPDTIAASECSDGKAYRKVWHDSEITIDGCGYVYYAEYYCERN